MTVRLDGIKLKDNQTWTNLLDLIYPVGSYYMSAESTSPASRFGGTWTQIKDRMLIGAGDVYTTINGTGGSASVTLTTNNLPSHTHTVGAHAHGLNGHAHSVGAHAHGLNGHTHSYNAPNANTNNTTLTINQMPSHTHTITSNKQSTPAGSGGTQGFPVEAYFTTNKTQLESISSTGGGKAHSHGIGTTSTNTGGNSGNTANSTAFNTGGNTGNTANSAVFDSGSTGSGTAITTISPYYIAYIWKRTA